MTLLNESMQLQDDFSPSNDHTASKKRVLLAYFIRIQSCETGFQEIDIFLKWTIPLNMTLLNESVRLQDDFSF